MKFLILALFVAVATAAPIEEDSGPVDVIVNGVPEGQPIDLSDIVDIKLKEHSDGQVVATNLLHPFNAVGIAEAAAGAGKRAFELEADVPEVIITEPVVIPEPVVVPEPVVMPSPVAPEVEHPEVVVPEPVVMPSPVAPEVEHPEAVIPEPVVMPSPVAPEVEHPEVVVPEPVVMPPPVAPEVVLPVAVVPEPVVMPSPVAPELQLPEPASLPSGEIFNDGTVSVTVNVPQEAGVLSSIQGWFSMVLNYFTAAGQTSHQIV